MKNDPSFRASVRVQNRTFFKGRCTRVAALGTFTNGIITLR